jgi:hypothetical protein
MLYQIIIAVIHTIVKSALICKIGILCNTSAIKPSEPDQRNYVLIIMASFGPLSDKRGTTIGTGSAGIITITYSL